MSILNTVGNTPLVELTSLVQKPNVKILAKLEGQNPGGSVKDRAALNMISNALKRGDIKPGDELIEASSGNTGIALAMIARLKGLKLHLVMPENSTRERILTMQAYGANVILTPAELGIEYSRTYSQDLAATKGYFLLNQFGNKDNYGAHYAATGPEIWESTQGKVTHFVSAMGTTGTIMGVSRYLKEKDSAIQIVGTQPKEGASIPGIRRWSPEFVPAIFEPNRVDRIIDVSEEEATISTRNLAKYEGVLAGMSSGGALHAALQVASEIESGVIVTIVCDKGDRYLSTDLFNQQETWRKKEEAYLKV